MRRGIHLGATVEKVLGATDEIRRGARLARETRLRATDIAVE